MTTQKKVILIRDSDFIKYQKNNTDSWDNLEFRPITRDWLQKQANWFTLKGNKNIATQYRHWPYPAEWVRRTNLSKYQHNYEGWLYRWDDAGVLRVRASLGHAENTMGILIMERFEVMLDDLELNDQPMSEESDDKTLLNT